MNLIKISILALRNGGFMFFVKKVIRSPFNRINLLKQKKAEEKAKNNPQEVIKVINQLKNFNSNDPEKVFTFACNFYSCLIRPMQIKEEFFELLKIFQKLNPKYILEIGTANGGSLFCFCRLANPSATIISIDLPEEPFSGGYQRWKIPIYQAFTKENQKLYLLKEDSHKEETLQKVKEILNGNELDFLYIDGDHSYEGVKKDFEMYGPLIRKGGIIAFHDISFSFLKEESSVDVPKFWGEIKFNYNYEEFVKDRRVGYGIGVIYIK